MRDRGLLVVVVILIALSSAACTTGNVEPSRFVSASNVPALTPAPSFSPSATPTHVVAATLPTTAPTESPAPTASPTPSPTGSTPTWTGTMNSTSNYTVTAQDGGLVCSATWITQLAFNVGPDSRVAGSATTDIVGAPVCTHPEVQSTQTTSIVSTIEGSASSSQLQLRLKYGSYDPVGSVEATGMSSSIYGFAYDSSPTITIPITSVGHAEGSQQLQSISGVNAYTSQNTITLDCQGC